MNLDLNSENYKLTELEEILELPPGYDASIVEMKETKMRQNIMNDSSVDQTTKMRTIKFLKEVKNKIITKLTQKTGPTASASIPTETTVGNIFSNDTNDKKDENIISHKVDPYILANPSKYFKNTKV